MMYSVSCICFLNVSIITATSCTQSISYAYPQITSTDGLHVFMLQKELNNQLTITTFLISRFSLATCPSLPPHE